MTDMSPVPLPDGAPFQPGQVAPDAALHAAGIAPQQPDGDVIEVETRDRVAVQLLIAAEKMCEAAAIAQGENNADGCAKYGAAALDYVKAHVLLAPIEAADDLAQSPGA